MSNNSFFSFGESLVFVGRHVIPLLWSIAFDENELRRGEENEDGETTLTFETTAGRATERFAAIAKSLEGEGNEYLREAWEACGPVARSLAELPKDLAVVLDASEIEAMVEEGVVEADLVAQMQACAKLRKKWDPELALSMTHVVREDVLTGNLELDRKRVRRVTGASSNREGFFALLFGHVEGESAAPLRAWLDAAPRAEAVRSTEEEATMLADALVAQGVIAKAPEDPETALRLLEAVARFRTPAALQQILDVLFGQKAVALGRVKPVDFAPLDRIVGMDQAEEVPVFAPEVLAGVLAVIGD